MNVRIEENRKNYMDETGENVPEEILDEWLDVFSLFDSSGDGTIKTSDLGNVLRGLGRIPTEKLLQSIIEEVDTDGNNSVDVDEFLMVMKKYPKEDLNSSLIKDSLEGLTAETNGFIDLGLLRNYLINTGEQLTTEEVWELEEKLVPDGDGKVSIDSLVHVLCRTPTT